VSSHKLAIQGGDGVEKGNSKREKEQDGLKDSTISQPGEGPNTNNCVITDQAASWREEETFEREDILQKEIRPKDKRGVNRKRKPSKEEELASSGVERGKV